MVIFGGKGDPGSQKHQHKTAGILGDMWEFDLVEQTWEQITLTSSKKPSARFLSDFTQHNMHSKVDNSTHPEMYIFGGDENVGKGGRVDDLWEYDMLSRQWSELSRSYPC